MAALSPAAPLLSWAASEISPGVFTTKYSIHLVSGRAFLIVFPLERVPKGQRITNAELIVPVHHVDSEQRLTIRRVLGAWGPGVCHKYRSVRPKAVEWGQPGAAAPATDCAAKASANVRISARGDRSINVTEDVELWYTGAAANHGWLLRTEDQHASLHLMSPIGTYPNGIGRWKLRITYEPE
jgi:hypothetical protein